MGNVPRDNKAPVVPYPPGLFRFSRRVDVETAAGEVGQQRLDPHIKHVLVVPGKRDAPIGGRAADARVPQPLPDPVQHLVSAEIGNHVLRVGLVKLEQPVLVGRELEVVGLFREVL